MKERGAMQFFFLFIKKKFINEELRREISIQ